MQIQLTNAGLKTRDHWRVRGVNLTVEAGKIVTLIGPNGAGKSTTVKLALGLEKPTEGLCQRAPGLRIGYVPQKLAIDWTMPITVARFMNLYGGIKASQAQGALDAVGLHDQGKAALASLSGGEFQRVLIARAIARRPNLLVLDEPAQGIDITGESQIYQLIQNLRDELGCGVLMISHDLHLVMAATDTVVCLNGHVCCHGTPTAVANNQAYQALFGADAAQQLAVYDHHHDHHHLPDGEICKDHSHG
ncbi:MAG: ATP-binding cassette domain-containing protein [Litorivicinus sp.]